LWLFLSRPVREQIFDCFSRAQRSAAIRNHKKPLT
jgi:hypothetical protein